MKIFSSISFCLLLFWQSSFYSLTFNKITGESVQMSALSGKKILVVPFKTAGSLQSLDSLQKANIDSLQVIAVPALDLEGTAGGNEFSTADTSGLSLILTQPMLVKKGSSNQHPLFRWLTNASANTHFDLDVMDEGQMFFVSQKGTLYAVLNRRAPASLIRNLINRNINK